MIKFKIIFLFLFGQSANLDQVKAKLKTLFFLPFLVALQDR